MRWNTALALVLLTLSAARAEDDPRLAQSRDIASEFQSQLGGRLMSALNGPGGAVEAIAVCRDQAPEIAAGVSEAHGIQAGRTALRWRSPGNAPDPSQEAVMTEFQRLLSTGAESPPERFEARPDGSARYMKAIVTQPMCLICHGAELPPEVAEALDRHYPDDQATGFAAGELRGAFVIEWPPGEGSSP